MNNNLDRYIKENQTQLFTSSNSAQSQRKRILAHLREWGSLTTLQARHELDCMHPGMRVCELRKAGYQIETVWVEDISYPMNRIHRIAKYVLGRKHPVQLPLFQSTTVAS